MASISNLYKSVDKLNATYMTTEKTFWLKPHKSFICYNGSPRIEYAIPPIYYACDNANSDFHSKHQLSTRAGQRCVCGHELTNQLHFLDHPSSSSFSSSSANPDQMIPGFVKEAVTFIITDDLNILPISTITRIILLNQLEVKDLSELEEMTVTVGPDKVNNIPSYHRVLAKCIEFIYCDNRYFDRLWSCCGHLWLQQQF